jgi:predicted RNA binding protein YcfA (HicA-like mRNA interferase family)
MVKPAKLYLQLLESTRRTVAFRDFVALVLAFGFEEVRSRGSHRCFSHPDCQRLLVIQPKGSDAKGYQVRELLDMIEEYGLTLED